MTRPTSPLDLGLLVVTGKGGVGKTTVAAAAACVAAERGRSVLLCDIDASGGCAEVLEVPRPGYEPAQARPGLDVMEMDTAAAMFHYLETFTPFGPIARRAPLSRGLSLMGSAAPGVREVLALGRLLWAVREGEYDLVIMDGPATGHVVAHLASPSSIGSLAAGGLLAGQTSWLQEMVTDPATSGVVVVTLPEPGPVNETIELLDELDRQVGIDRRGVAVNRMREPLGLRTDRELLGELEAVELPDPLATLVRRRVDVAARHDAEVAQHRRFRNHSGASPVWSIAHADAAPPLAAAIDALAEEW